MIEINGKVAECYVECFDRMFYLVFKDVSGKDIQEIEHIMKNSYEEWASGDDLAIIDTPCEEYIKSTLKTYKDKIIAVIYEDNDEEDFE